MKMTTQNIIIAVLAVILLFMIWRNMSKKSCSCSGATMPGTLPAGSAGSLGTLPAGGAGSLGNLPTGGQSLDQMASASGLSGDLVAGRYAMNLN